MPDRLRAAIAQRVLDRLDELVEDLGRAYRQVPEYASLSDDEMRSEILPVSNAVARRFLEAVSKGKTPKVERLAELRHMGSRRIEMGVPLEPMLHVFRVFGRRVWDELAAVTTPGELNALADLAGDWMEYIDRASSVAASSYLEAAREELATATLKRDALFQGLLTANTRADVTALAASMNTELATRYMPVVIHGSDSEEVLAAAPRGSICGFRANQMIALCPDADVSWLGGLEFHSAVRGRLAAVGSELAEEFRSVEVLATLAREQGASGILDPLDLLFEQFAEVSGWLASAAAARFAPLEASDQSGDLTATLRAWFATGTLGDAAGILHVHANTVAYRLNRVRDITGLDPRVPGDAAKLAFGAACLAKDRIRIDNDRPISSSD